ncbi:iron complex transport system substrate-binding protein [Deinobacterium chartae]|uniref:Iron complex transport system substrate-binding protein n=1 Tax=Deinobacterium chartae TaxID=521158 RepID=A0A841I2Z8_9DEIO|nr:ABC transporter substrate-binding protein [Deinobacterium chartae]MBB6098728.1 iron complex transport system substrate-binding protein [Deinobacterium chartae]
MKRFLLLMTALTLGTLLLPGAWAVRYPLTLTDDLGREVTLKEAPRRVISLLPSTTETVCALGACERLIGVDDYSDYPPQAARLPKFGGLYDPNIEAIVAARPDLVLISKYGRLEEPLRRAGVPTLAVHPERFEDIFSKTTLLGRVFDLESAASRLNARVRADVARVEVLTRHARRVSTYLEVDPTPYSVGPQSFMGVMIEKAGGSNIVPAALGEFPRISPELVVQKNPQVMLGLTLEEARRRPGWAGLRAVRSKRVYKLPRDLDLMLSRPGPRIGVALEVIARRLHPELFR